MSGAPVPALSFREVSLRYGERSALSRVTFEARSGELVALTGPNGSGKTSLLRCALGLAEPSGGGAWVLGDDARGLSPKERALRVAWVPQDESPRDNVRVGEYVLYGRYAHLPPFVGEGPADRAAALRSLSDVDLTDRVDSGILELSGGERQRLLLARALAQEAPVLLLDEPTAHLDIGHQLDLLGRVRRLVQERRVCAVAALHDLNLAARFADRVVVLSHGRVVADGSPAEVLQPALLRQVWGVLAERRRDPRTGQTFLLPVRAIEPTAESPPSRRPLVHVVGGGGAASELLRRLLEEGWPVTAGALPLLDTDAETAEELGIPFAAELPFAPLSEGVRQQHRGLLDAAAIIVLAPIPVGPSNLGNLEDLVGRAARQPVILFEPTDFSTREFAGGAATRLRDQVVAEGARIVRDLDALLQALAQVAETRPPPDRSGAT